MVPKDHIIRYQGIPKPNIYLLVFGILISFLLHLASVSQLTKFVSVDLSDENKKKSPKVRVKVVRTEKDNKRHESKKLLEARQKKTEAPDRAKYLGHNDHKAAIETKARKTSGINSYEASVESQKGLDEPSGEIRPKIGVGAESLTSDSGVKSLYQKLLPKNNELAQLRQKNYQEFIDEEMNAGDSIDISTSSYRYIGYFTGLRKGWSQTWVYPSEAARRGIQGAVRVQLTIQKDGRLQRVKVLETSGYKILDQAVIDAVKLSAPYAPLPDGIGRDRLTINSIFTYRLSNYGGTF